MGKEGDFRNKKFWIRWSLSHLIGIPVIYLVSLFFVLIVHGEFFHFTMTEWGTPLSQTLMQVAGGFVLATGIGVLQYFLLRKLFKVNLFWILALILGFIIGELIAGTVLWQLGLNRGELRFIEFKPLPEALIFCGIGLLAGSLQFLILRRYFEDSEFWIVSSALGWGGCILINAAIPELFILLFPAGALLYGAVTGYALLLMNEKK